MGQHKQIMKTLTEHGVSVAYESSNVGPTITQHVFSLRPGTRLAEILKLNDDVALSLGLQSIRVLAPVPGTTFIGYEAPSTDRSTVTYADVCTGDVDESHDLSIPLGVTTSGEVKFLDLTKAPHLLVAGQTGSGKSVAMTTALTYLIDHYSVDDLEIYLIDPKKVELSMFDNAVHVKDTAVEVFESIAILEHLTSVMDNRYRMFKDAGVRNISEYNIHNVENTLPRIVLAVDEMADLMLTNKKLVEPLIVRLVQLARACGIHVILATQRPTVNVVTGLIKANVPTRWAFTVAQNVDSKVILDDSGAESLYGAGDSLIDLPGIGDPVRVQGILTTDEDIDGAVERSHDSHQAEVESDPEPEREHEPEQQTHTIVVQPKLHGSVFAVGGKIYKV